MNNEQKLKHNISLLSIDQQDWSHTMMEWRYSSFFFQKGSVCLCGKRNITKVCVIKNVKNGNSAEVGNCCVNKFLFITDANSRFKSLLKIYKNIKSNISKDLRQELVNTGFITEDEYHLLSSFDVLFGQRTSDEWKQKIGINHRILKHYVKDRVN